jgi:Rrf2 family protein
MQYPGMRMSEGIEWGIHAATVLAMVPDGQCLSAAKLADYHGVPAPYLAKHLQAMTRAGVLESVPGRTGGFRLARPAGDITVLDIVEAIDGDEPAFVCTEIRRRGPFKALGRAEFPMPCSVLQVMDEADAAWRAHLRATTVADLLGAVARAASPRSVERGVRWFQEALVPLPQRP